MRTKEETIVKIKNKMKEVKTQLTFLNTKVTELKKQKADDKTRGEEFEKNLQTCNTEKVSDNVCPAAQPTLTLTSACQRQYVLYI